MVSGPLSDIRVIDLTQVLSGPFCSMLLADMGADVIKVEPPSGDVARRWGPHPAVSGEVEASYGGYFASVNRNKRSVVLDLRTPQGVEDLHRLLSTADVLLENYRVGVMDRLGLSYESLHERYPALVYASIRGFGDPRTGESPYADWPAFDIIAQAMGGILGITGTDPEHPVKVGPGVGDIFPAALAATGILAALHEAQRTGLGQLVDVAMYDAVLSLTERIVYQYSITGESPAPQGNTHPLLCPYGLVRTADGFVALATPTDHHWGALCEIMNRHDLEDHPQFATNDQRLVNASEVYQIVEEWSSRKTSTEAVSALTGIVPCAPVNSAADIARDPHVEARNMIRSVEHPSGSLISIAGAPIKFSGHGEDPFARAPVLGEHNHELLDNP
jgi:crotonobetainyl-CoA:carnitine CoA-transferase CaiB-like acyl-CoA transferase